MKEEEEKSANVPVAWMEMTIAIDLKAREPMGAIEDRARLQLQVATGGQEGFLHPEWSQLFRAAVLQPTAAGEFTLSLPIAVRAGTEIPLGLELVSRRGRRRGLDAALRRDDDATQRLVQAFLRRAQLGAQALADLADLVNNSKNIEDDLRLFSRARGVNADILLRYLHSKGQGFSVTAAETKVQFKRHLVRATAPQDDVRWGVLQPIDRLLQEVKIEGFAAEDVEGPPRRVRARQRRGEDFVMTTNDLVTAMVLTAAAMLRLPIKAGWQGGRKLKGERRRTRALTAIANLAELKERVAAAALGTAEVGEPADTKQLPLFDK